LIAEGASNNYQTRQSYSRKQYENRNPKVASHNGGLAFIPPAEVLIPPKCRLRAGIRLFTWVFIYHLFSIFLAVPKLLSYHAGCA
jgi:hypothetical protein